MNRKFCLIGPPGSGKGSYGKLLAKSLSLPLITVSTLLKTAGLDVGTGNLVQDDDVNEVLLQNLPENYLLDGFPRTKNQLALMEQTWAEPLQGAISLEVPRQVCLEKLLGRRSCTLCGENWNLAHVEKEGFHLPPKLPIQCTRCRMETHWTTRADDAPSLVEKRLDIFHFESKPILQYFEAKGALLQFAPYRGFLDMPLFESKVIEWSQNRDI
jgi:adenylate kinase